jgi:hypothetical protein
MKRTFYSAAAVLIAVSAVAAAPALAGAALPTYDGAVAFPNIKGPADPEEFSWEVTLGKGQELQQVDAQHAQVAYDDGTIAATIDAERAHDAEGSEVPTSLAVSDGNVVTLTVHHRAGNSAADGAPFIYPVVGGPGFVIGPVEVVVGPFDEQELREARERIERENRAQVSDEGRPQVRCLVPRLKGRSLKKAAQRLRKANCKLGEISRGRNVTAKTGKVVKQSPKAGAGLAGGAVVNVTLGG